MSVIKNAKREPRYDIIGEFSDGSTRIVVLLDETGECLVNQGEPHADNDLSNPFADQSDVTTLELSRVGVSKLRDLLSVVERRVMRSETMPISQRAVDAFTHTFNKGYGPTGKR